MSAPPADRSRAAFVLVAAVVCVVFGQLAGTAHAGPCSDQIAQLRARSASMHNQPGAAPSARQSVVAQLGHQPTPASVQQAEQGAWSNFAAVLAHAGTLDNEGKSAECMKAVANARRILELN